MKTGIYWQDPKYALRPGRGFIFDPSLVLYLPLHKLDGASIMSCDAYGHLGTVTGALWTPNGREFDGTDDKIAIPYHASFDVVSDITVEAWVNKHAGGSLVTRHSVSPTINVWKLLTSAYEFWGAGNGGYTSISVPGVGIWYQLAMTFKSKDTRRAFVNGEVSHAVSVTGTLPQSTVDGIALGSRLDNAEWLDGLIGEVRIYNRALTPLEIQQNYLATKWRYQ